MANLVPKGEFRQYLTKKGWRRVDQLYDNSWGGEVWYGGEAVRDDVWIPLDERVKEHLYNSSGFNCTDAVVDIDKFDKAVQEINDEYDNTHCLECGQYLG